MKFSFIHTADIHLGRAFSGIDYILSKEQEEILNTAHEKAFASLCDFAIEENVDFVLISGDTFDSCEHDLHSRLVLYNALKRLEVYNIRVYIVPGNHDPASSYTKELTFEDSEYIKIFGVNTESSPTIVKDKNNVNLAVIFPFVFKTSEYPYSPCTVLEKPTDFDIFNIGLIHCDTGGGNNPYAPCSQKELLELKYDYYALGHIHKPEINDFIVYPGTIQARSVKDIGEHGFCYVKVDNNKIISNDFIKCDKVRYYNIAVSVTDDKTSVDTVIKIKNIISRISAGTELVIINLTLNGVCSYNLSDIEGIEKELSSDKIIINQLENNTSFDVNIDLIKSGILAQIIKAGSCESCLKTILDKTNKELEELLKYKTENNYKYLENKAVQSVNNMCREVYSGSRIINE